ncbi:JmjC domain-containing protein [Coniochaeta sp. 2T2.1]|nr:JmjC domain-containing protein [Coniochaeta sp. 2T2.1]
MRPTLRLLSRPLAGHVPESALQRTLPEKRNFIRTLEPIRRSVEAVTPAEFSEYTRDEKPLVFKQKQISWEGSRLTQKWFVTTHEHGAHASTYLNDFGRTLVTYELTLTRNVGRFTHSLERGDLREIVSRFVVENSYADKPSHFIRFQAPLALFLAALDYNSKQEIPANRLSSLYIAQSSIADLPSSLREDIAPPPLVDTNGIYSSSIWMGLTPTYTPLHRDPNPNLFRQLHGSKVVRIIPKKSGHGVFAAVQASIRGSANSRLRGEEMMDGPEKDVLHDAVWTDEGNPKAGERTFYEARLDAGDALYLPSGWWHSLKSTPADRGKSEAASEGELNCSVNWWFRSSPAKKEGRATP